MASIWVESLGRACDEALDRLAAALRDCPDNLWAASMWAVPADAFGPEPPDPDGTPVTDRTARQALAQRRSTPWSVAWHALETLDYDLTGEFGPWAPPPLFAGHPHWLLTRLPAPWTRSDLLGYLDYCRGRARDTFATMTDERAATPCPRRTAIAASRTPGSSPAPSGTRSSTRRRSGSSSPAQACPQGSEGHRDTRCLQEYSQGCRAR